MYEVNDTVSQIITNLIAIEIFTSPRILQVLRFYFSETVSSHVPHIGLKGRKKGDHSFWDCTLYD